jgi:hypothetical protein
VADGHRQLRENLGKLSGVEIRHTLANFGRDLRLIREGLQGYPN